ncbi:ATP-dependent helicase/nuclease subunit A [Aquisphaera giovannonii]|uniref:DNA 3'-5' helicase n=1 Tax=Aquisphaera giovannonii TaxID=406548 RepID=A0A5B9VZQ0_9BACT|nr:UvrD-helicase domain-containing protein [Aquisphaera giovannonii]QEH33842.1 ATP-dependent helicase/nuclease subunit A [Aquisphaera giovannonii]
MTPPTTPEIRLTDEQRRALEVKSSSVALGAGAGCGKTLVLTERFLGELEADDASSGADGRALGELAALTFTEKAARELRQRIRARCRQKLASGADPARWRAVLRALESAPIGTFHEFCAMLLRTRALELGIDPEFRIVDAPIAASLRDRAVRTTMRRRISARDPDLALLSIDYSLDQVREALDAILSRRTGDLVDRWAELSEEDVVARWRDAWEARGRPAVLAGLTTSIRDCRRTLDELPGTIHPKLAARRAELLQVLDGLEGGGAGEGDLAAARSLARIDDLREKAIWPSADAKDAIKGAFESLRKAIDRARERLEFSDEVTRENAANSLRLVRLVKQVQTEYEHVKRRRQALDFDDLLGLTRRLLDRPAPPPAARGGIDFIMVDEFQDTDQVQSDILRLLAGEAFAGGRMFVVGDEKQSIYRFRGAEPAIFGRWRGEFPADGRLPLTENFRSVPGVLHFVNALFADAFRPDGGPGGEWEPPRLVPVRDAVVPDPAVTFHWASPAVRPGESAEAEARPKLTSGDRRANEARSLARWLRTRLDAGWTVLDRQSRRPRAAQAGDVAFLFRAMTDVWPYETALADEGFDYHTLGGSAFFAQQEVRDVVNVLSAVEDPLDEVALAGALRGPFFSLSDEALFWLARKVPGGITRGILRAGEIQELSDRDRACATRAAALLDRWRGIKDRVPLATLVATVLDESGFESALVCEFLGERKLANTRKLVRLARDFDRQESFTLADLVDRLRADLENPPSEEQASTTDEQSPIVRLMSIHQAKGLEFPIVVLPDLGRQPSPREGLVGLREDVGLVIRPSRQIQLFPDGEPAEAGSSLGWMAYTAVESEEDRRESLRLFYVAATRARDHLVLSAGLDAPKESEAMPPRSGSPALQLLLERFDWRTGDCRADLPEGWPSPAVDVRCLAAPDADSARAGSSRRPPLREIEEAITRTAVRDEPAPRSPRWPAWIDLAGQSDAASREARLGTLIRSVIVDRGLLRGGTPAMACSRAAERMVPAGSSALSAEAAERLRDWSAMPLFGALREANRAGRPIEADVAWSVRWPVGEEGESILRGRFDILYLDRSGNWRPVIVSTRPSEVDADRLRLHLAPIAAAGLARVPCGPAWWVSVGQAGDLEVENELPAPPASVGAAIAEWLASRRWPS